MMMAEHFKIREGGFEEIKKDMLKRSIPSFVLLAVFGIGVSYLQEEGHGFNYITIPFIVLILCISLTAGIYIGVKRQRKLMDSYELTLDEQGITREQYNTPAISIPYADIKEINQNANGSITVKSTTRADIIGIPKQIGDPDRLEQLLSAHATINMSPDQPFYEKYKWLSAIFMLALYAPIYLSKDRRLIATCGILLICILSYSMYTIQRSKNVDRTTKNTKWIVLFAFSYIVLRVYYALMG